MATTTPRSSKTLSLKLTIDNSSDKVVFAEAGKEFVDFLFGLLQIPIGSIVGLLLDNGMVGSGSLGRVQESIKNLDPSYLQPNQSKDPLLRPKAAYTPLFLQNLASSNIETIPSIPDKKTIQSINPASSSPFGGPSVFQISKPIKTTSPFSSPSLNPVVSSVVQLEENGYVRGVVTYRVMDDLRVMPMPVMSTITVLKNSNIKDVNSLQEKTVEVDIKKGLELLMVSLRSATVLTEVFLGHKVLQENSYTEV